MKDIQEKDFIAEEDASKKLGILPKILFFLLFLCFLLYFYMHFVEPKKLIVKEYAVVNELIPDSFNGFKIVQFSDIYFGSTINEKELNQVSKKINELKPDILIFSGNLFSSSIQLSSNNKAFLQEFFQKLDAKIKKLAIKGNADYMDIELYEMILKNSNFTILDNINIPIYYNGNTPIYISGIPSVSQKEQDLTKAFIKEDEKNAYQILVMHEPILFNDVSRDANLILAGHSLGGLIRLPYIGGLISLDNTNDYLDDIYIKGKSTMYISSGIGTEKMNVRIFNLPSISLYRLYNYE